MKIVKKILIKFRQFIALVILKIFGWSKSKIYIPESIKKAIVIGAPHTSYWDTFWSVLAAYAYLPNRRIFGLFKLEANKSFWGWFYRLIGGIPVDRNKVLKENKNKSTVEIVSNKIKNMDKVLLAISPEGTRKLNKKWKTGFYYIALNANVPIILSSLDYKKKEINISKIVYPTGDFKKDMKLINEYYKSITAKYPEKFSINLFYNENIDKKKKTINN